MNVIELVSIKPNPNTIFSFENPRTHCHHLKKDTYHIRRSNINFEDLLVRPLSEIFKIFKIFLLLSLEIIILVRLIFERVLYSRASCNRENTVVSDFCLSNVIFLGETFMLGFSPSRVFPSSPLVRIVLHVMCVCVI